MDTNTRKRAQRIRAKARQHYQFQGAFATWPPISWRDYLLTHAEMAWSRREPNVSKSEWIAAVLANL